MAADSARCDPAVAVMRSPRSLDVDITSRCNLRCRYCYYFDNSAVSYRDLPTADWLRFFEECGRAAVMDLTLAGGEPFLRPDLRELLNGIRRNRMRFSLLSNGGPIDDEMAEFLARTGRCDSVQISIDGSCAAVHDAARGKGSWAAAVRGLRTLQRHGVHVNVRLTIHRYNVDDLDNAARFLLEDLGLPEFGTNAAGYLGSCRLHGGDLMLSLEQRQRAMETLLRLSEKYDGRISAAAGPLADARTWRAMEEARARGAEPFPHGGHLTGCGCHAQTLAVRSDGAYVVCSMLAHTVLGWINRDSLLEIWQRHPTLEAMRRRHRIPLRQFAECRDCPYADYCTGNCPGLSYTLTGEIDRPSPDACLRRFLAAGGRIPALEQAAPAAEEAQ